MANKTLQNINPDGKSLVEVFISDEENAGMIQNRAIDIYKEGEKQHDALCPHTKGECRGANAYVMDVLKEELLTVPHTDAEVLALVAEVCFIIGVESGKLFEKLKNNPEKLLQGLFAKFLEEKRRKEEDDE